MVAVSLNFWLENNKKTNLRSKTNKSCKNIKTQRWM